MILKLHTILTKHIKYCTSNIRVRKSYGGKNNFAGHYKCQKAAAFTVSLQVLGRNGSSTRPKQPGLN